MHDDRLSNPGLIEEHGDAIPAAVVANPSHNVLDDGAIDVSVSPSNRMYLLTQEATTTTKRGL